MVVVVKIYDAVSTKTCLIWKEHWHKRFSYWRVSRLETLTLPYTVWVQQLLMQCSPDGPLCNIWLCCYLSHADTWILFNTVQDTLLNIRCSSPIDSKRLKCSCVSKAVINGGICFMVWMASVWEHLLAEAHCLQPLYICMTLQKMHVHHFIKWIPIHTIVFMITQCNKIRI
jgi:hypothetical protein